MIQMDSVLRVSHMAQVKVLAGLHFSPEALGKKNPLPSPLRLVAESISSCCRTEVLSSAKLPLTPEASLGSLHMAAVSQIPQQSIVSFSCVESLTVALSWEESLLFRAHMVTLDQLR